MKPLGHHLSRHSNQNSNEHVWNATSIPSSLSLSDKGQYCVLHNEDEKWKIDCIQFYLSGRAFEQYDCMSDEEKNDYPTVCRLLRRYFAVAPLPSALA